ncbi:unnamed protein product [Sphenostylis stenocarpa]|uniref:Uncharacterized protein n=1 Tax=Sphenostylis stenocarpa TaxID=92480 RepID=A0AA86SZ41_9FABA|nr:unnamed protein product [Sphenostylis stenocarpa]
MESENNLRLPLSHDDPKQSEERQRKVSTMTRKGVFAALSYMASSAEKVNSGRDEVGIMLIHIESDWIMMCKGLLLPRLHIASVLLLFEVTPQGSIAVARACRRVSHDCALVFASQGRVDMLGYMPQCLHL